MSENHEGFYCSLFLALFIFRYLHLFVHIISWCFYRPVPIPDRPSYHASDVTVVIPTVDPDNKEFRECLDTCLSKKPKHIFIIGVGAEIEERIKGVVKEIDIPEETEVTILSADKPNKRIQISKAIPEIQTRILMLLDDHVFLTKPNFLPTVLAPFEDPRVGAVGTNKRVRRTRKSTHIESIWNMLGALYLERYNFLNRATNAIDGGVPVLSGRCAIYRTKIINTEAAINNFINERFFFGRFGPLNSDDDNYLTRLVVNGKWKIKIQHCEDALIETTLGTYPKFPKQCLRWSRTTWRSNATSLFIDRTVWKTQPWCVYAVYLYSFVNFALFYDSYLVYVFYNTTWKAQYGLCYLLMFIFATKLVKLISYFLREPWDLIYLPAYYVFAYFHSFIKLYALFTFWDISWSGRDLNSIKESG